MDHAHYGYSALPRRLAVAFAQGPRLHAFVVLCLEHWDAEPIPDALRDPRFVGEFGSFSPDYRSWTQREYGLRLGLFRVLDALREAGITPAVAANARALLRLPELARRLAAQGCEFIGHGLAANDLMHGDMPHEAQRDHIARSLAAFDEVLGARPLGWLSQDWGTSPDTFELLAAAGLRYTLDWCNDDQPYALRTTPALTAIPLSAEWDDVQCQWLRHLTPAAHADLARQAFGRLQHECVAHRRGAVFGLALHPWVCGMPSRIGALRGLLQTLRAHDGVAWVQPAELLLPQAARFSNTSDSTPTP
ncbi:MAG: polysaccharide deacetylase family protein [Hydrogenophaga sp.]|nr:polysaccharide deacetylase family protein [Hydrogenophaga sp.]